MIPKTTMAARGTKTWKANTAVADSNASVPVMSRIAASRREQHLFASSAGELNIFMMLVWFLLVGLLVAD